jgi:hypothetical protein
MWPFPRNGWALFYDRLQSFNCISNGLFVSGFHLLRRCLRSPARPAHLPPESPPLITMNRPTLFIGLPSHLSIAARSSMSALFFRLLVLVTAGVSGAAPVPAQTGSERGTIEGRVRNAVSGDSLRCDAILSIITIRSSDLRGINVSIRSYAHLALGARKKKALH